MHTRCVRKTLLQNLQVTNCRFQRQSGKKDLFKVVDTKIARVYIYIDIWPYIYIYGIYIYIIPIHIYVYVCMCVLYQFLDNNTPP